MWNADRNARVAAVCGAVLATLPEGHLVFGPDLSAGLRIQDPPSSCLSLQKPQAPGALVHVQVGVVQQGVQGGAFRVLPSAEVDEHLTALSERD